MKKVLLLLVVLMCKVISLASISYTAKLDPTLLDIITVVEALNGNASVIHNFIGHGCPGGIDVGTDSSGGINGLLAIENTTGDQKYDWNHNHESKNGLNNLTNKYYPGWTYSMSCSLMPFDIFVDSLKNMTYDVTRNFGESYILGKDYGGVAMMGNTRPSYLNVHRDFFKKVFEKVWETYKNKTADPYEKLYASTMRNEIWQLPYNPLSGGIYEKIKHNLFGDPLTELRFGEPIQFTINRQSNNSSIYYIGMSGPINTDNYIYATVPLIDATYASWEENDVCVEKSIELIPNEIQVLTAKNAIPKILPLHIQNFLFDGSTTPYIFADQVFIEKANPYDKEDKVIFSSTADVTIESLSDVFVDEGTIFESGSKLTINAAREANLCRITIPAGATLIVNAQRIVYGEDLVTFYPNSTVIFNGKKITNGSSKSVARRSDYDPLVKEGKTFWYYKKNELRDEDSWISEFGMQIGGTVNVEGEEWHEVNLIREAVLDIYGNVRSVCDESETIQYIREKDLKVQTMNCPDDSQHSPWYKRDPIMVLDNFFFADEGYWYIDDIHNVTFDLYDFTPGGEEYAFGSEYGNYVMTLKGEETRENSGIARRVKTYTKKTFESSILEEPASAIFKNQEFQLVEGVGVHLVKSTPTEESNMNELFFAPFCADQTARSPMPNGYFLRYVTDEDNNVVYEGRGGLKLWTIAPSGVEDVVVDSSDDVEWYTLSGVRVSSPVEHGVYIRKCGSNAEKVRF